MAWRKQCQCYLKYYKQQPILRRQFRSEFKTALQSYQIDIGVMDEEIQRMELEKLRRRKGRTRRILSSTLPSTHDFKVVMMKTRVVRERR